MSLLDEAIKIVPSVIQKQSNRSNLMKSIIHGKTKTLSNQFKEASKEKEEAKEDPEEDHINELVDLLVSIIN